MKIGLCNGWCCRRFDCKNVNKKVCKKDNVIIKKKFFGLIRTGYIECEHYKE